MKITITPYNLTLIQKALTTYSPDDDLEKEELTALIEWVTFLLENQE